MQRATLDLRAAEAELADAESTRDVARTVAERMQGLADAAQQDADAAGRVYLAATHGDGTTISSMPAVFGAGNDLLAGLGGVARVAQIAGDADELLKIAEQRADDAAAAQERADAAWAAIDLVPVEDLEDAVADAEAALADAKQELADLQADATTRSRLASSSVSLIASLPTDAGQLSDQGWALPVAGRITDGFGPRPIKPLAGRERVPPRHRRRRRVPVARVRRDERRRGQRRAEREPRQLDPRRSRVRRRDGLRPPRRRRDLRQRRARR